MKKYTLYDIQYSGALLNVRDTMPVGLHARPLIF